MNSSVLIMMDMEEGCIVCGGASEEPGLCNTCNESVCADYENQRNGW